MVWSFLNNSDDLKNPSLSTYWSTVHFFMGVGAFVLYWNFFYPSLDPWIAFWILFMIHLVYELKDLYKSYVLVPKDTIADQNTLLNSLGDQLFFSLGFLMAWYFDWKEWYILLVTLMVYLAGEVMSFD